MVCGRFTTVVRGTSLRTLWPSSKMQKFKTTLEFFLPMALPSRLSERQATNLEAVMSVLPYRRQGEDWHSRWRKLMADHPTTTDNMSTRKNGVCLWRIVNDFLHLRVRKLLPKVDVPTPEYKLDRFCEEGPRLFGWAIRKLLRRKKGNFKGKDRDMLLRMVHIGSSHTEVSSSVTNFDKWLEQGGLLFPMSGFASYSKAFIRSLMSRTDLRAMLDRSIRHSIKAPCWTRHPICSTISKRCVWDLVVKIVMWNGYTGKSISSCGTFDSVNCSGSVQNKSRLPKVIIVHPIVRMSKPSSQQAPTVQGTKVETKKEAVNLKVDSCEEVNSGESLTLCSDTYPNQAFIRLKISVASSDARFQHTYPQ